MDREKKKALIIKYEGVLSRIYRLLGHNKIHITKGNTLNLGNAFLKRCRINIEGYGNVLTFETGLTRLKCSTVSIYGNNCHIQVGGNNLNYCSLIIEDDGGKIILNRHVTISGKTELSVIEGHYR